MSSTKLKGIYKLLICIIVCQLAGVIGSIFTIASIPGWYAQLVKPVFTPPNWLFTPAWITLYLLMAVAAFFDMVEGSPYPSCKKCSNFISYPANTECSVVICLFWTEVNFIWTNCYSNFMGNDISDTNKIL